MNALKTEGKKKKAFFNDALSLAISETTKITKGLGCTLNLLKFSIIHLHL